MKLTNEKQQSRIDFYYSVLPFTTRELPRKKKTFLPKNLYSFLFC